MGVTLHGGVFVVPSVLRERGERENSQFRCRIAKKRCGTDFIGEVVCLIGGIGNVSGVKKVKGNGCASLFADSYSLLLFLLRLYARPNQILPLHNLAMRNVVSLLPVCGRFLVLLSVQKNIFDETD